MGILAAATMPVRRDLRREADESRPAMPGCGVFESSPD
jgi:hypothetical protein